MSLFVEYDRFSTVENAAEYSSVLESNNIPFELVDNRNAGKPTQLSGSKRKRVISISFGSVAHGLLG